MTDLVFFDSPLGLLALTPDGVREAVVRANEAPLALCCEDGPTSGPRDKTRLRAVAYSPLSKRCFSDSIHQQTDSKSVGNPSTAQASR